MSVGAFLLALIATFVAAKLFGELAERIGQPAVLGELLGGVQLLFLIGLETELARLVACGPSAVVVAVAGVAITFAGGYAIGTALRFPPLVAARGRVVVEVPMEDERRHDPRAATNVAKPEL